LILHALPLAVRFFAYLPDIRIASTIVHGALWLLWWFAILSEGRDFWPRWRVCTRRKNSWSLLVVCMLWYLWLCVCWYYTTTISKLLVLVTKTNYGVSNLLSRNCNDHVVSLIIKQELSPVNLTCLICDLVSYHCRVFAS